VCREVRLTLVSAASGHIATASRPLACRFLLFATEVPAILSQVLRFNLTRRSAQVELGPDDLETLPQGYSTRYMCSSTCSIANASESHGLFVSHMRWPLRTENSLHFCTFHLH
jgi:hypothetical protein